MTGAMTGLVPGAEVAQTGHQSLTETGTEIETATGTGTEKGTETGIGKGKGRGRGTQTGPGTRTAAEMATDRAATSGMCRSRTMPPHVLSTLLLAGILIAPCTDLGAMPSSPCSHSGMQAVYQLHSTGHKRLFSFARACRDRPPERARDRDRAEPDADRARSVGRHRPREDEPRPRSTTQRAVDAPPQEAAVKVERPG